MALHTSQYGERLILGGALEVWVPLRYALPMELSLHPIKHLSIRVWCRVSAR